MAIIFGSLTYNDKTKGWLDKWLTENSKFCDKWVILDDCSNDGTHEVAAKFDEEKIKAVQMKESTFKVNENKIRNELWQSIREVAKPGDFIFILDSDEIILDKDFKDKVKCYKTQANYVFKKVEMWNKTEYRIDGLWSNYFSRGFMYEDKQWGYYEEGFHHPQVPSFCQKLKSVNTNMRIKHLAYESKDSRDSKYKFMMDNPQQKKDITYYHLQTLNNTTPELRKVEYDYNNKKVLVSFFCSNLYKIPNSTMKFLNGLDDNNIYDIMFIITNCHYNIINQIKTLDINCNKLNFYVELTDSEYNVKIYTKSFIKQKLKEKLENADEYDDIFMIDGDCELYDNFIYTYQNTDKDVCINENLKILYLNKKYFNEIFNSHWESLFAGKNEMRRVIDFFNNNKKFIWRTGNYGSFPINANLMIK